MKAIFEKMLLRCQGGGLSKIKKIKIGVKFN